tara:strand:- start:750 stop:1244 length:495 start_codon:yes stop_codon:yes gene_type:complete
MNNNTRIYCDMDGVLCDFARNIKITTGMTIDKWMRINPKHERWQPIVAKKDFWANMPWLNDGKNLWRFIEKYNPHILSAASQEDPNCKMGKHRWIFRNLNIPSGRIHLVQRHEKQTYAKTGGQPSILIDDYVKNTREFSMRGGVGITFKNASQVIGELKKLGFN